MIANVITCRKAVQCKEGKAVVGIWVGDWLPDDDLVCCGDRVAVLGCRSARTEGATLLRYFQNTQHSLSLSQSPTHTWTHLTSPHLTNTITVSCLSCYPGNTKPGDQVDTVVDCREEMMSKAKTSRAVKVFLFNNRRTENQWKNSTRRDIL